MSEFWVSKKKYFCKYCDIYIADDAPSIQQHENGLRHKGNVERFIRGIYKTGEKQKKELEEEKREMKRVEQAAAAAFAEDVGAGHAKLPAPVASTSTAPKKPVPKPSNPFANYSTAQSLGYTDPDAERLVAELELRRSQGIAGEWQIVAPLQPPVDNTQEKVSSAEGVSSAEIGVKRAAEESQDDDDTRAFKLRKKTLERGIGEIYDPGMIPVKIKKKEELKETKIPQLAPVTNPSASGAPKWTSAQWKRPGEKAQESGPAGRSPAADIVKVEDMIDVSTSSKWAKPQWSQPLPDLNQEERKEIFGKHEEVVDQSLSGNLTVKEEPDVKEKSAVKEELSTGSISELSTSLFKKRKVPAGGGRGRREI